MPKGYYVVQNGDVYNVVERTSENDPGTTVFSSTSGAEAWAKAGHLNASFAPEDIPPPQPRKPRKAIPGNNLGLRKKLQETEREKRQSARRAEYERQKAILEQHQKEGTERKLEHNWYYRKRFGGTRNE